MHANVGFVCFVDKLATEGNYLVVLPELVRRDEVRTPHHGAASANQQMQTRRTGPGSHAGFIHQLQRSTLSALYMSMSERRHSRWITTHCWHSLGLTVWREWQGSAACDLNVCRKRRPTAWRGTRTWRASGSPTPACCPRAPCAFGTPCSGVLPNLRFYAPLLRTVHLLSLMTPYNAH